MRTSNIWIILTAVSLLGVAGCSKSKEDTGGNAQSMGQQMQEQAGRAMEAASQFAGQTKDEVVAAAQKQLDNLQQKYQQWKAEHPAQTEQAQQKLNELQTAVESHLKTASDSLTKAKSAGADAWQTVASSAREAIASAQTAYDQLRTYAEKSEPNQPAPVEE